MPVVLFCIKSMCGQNTDICNVFKLQAFFFSNPKRTLVQHSQNVSLEVFPIGIPCKFPTKKSPHWGIKLEPQVEQVDKQTTKLQMIALCVFLP